MNLTRDIPSTANGGGSVMAGHHAGRQTTLLPRSPAEALEPLRPPEPPDRELPEENAHPFLRMLDSLFTFIFILACGTVAIFYFVRVEFDRPGPLRVSTVVVVPRGEGVTAIAERLEREGVIADRRIFMTSILYFMYLKGQGTLKAGEYEFDKHATMRQVLDTLVQGKSITHKVTLPEGLTSEQIVARLAAHPDLTGSVTETPPEGSLLPDTYSFASHEARDDIIQRMRVAQQKFLAKVWQERDPDVDAVIKTPEQAVILASIVEKETGRADERPHIANVFENRLRKRMRLQSDPTVIYGLFGGAGVKDHPITQDDLDQDNPYNTYKINGLPPTPIANPGRAAIEAVLKPDKTNDLYFCADGTGGHAFAATLAAHNKNVTRWRKIEAEIRAKQEEEAAAAAAAGGAAPGEAAPEAATAEANTTVGSPAASGAAPAMAADSSVPLPLRNPKR
jgi:UPF0755 protein